MKLFFQYLAIFFNVSYTASHLHPIQVENYDSNSQFLVDEDDTGKFRLERVFIADFTCPPARLSEQSGRAAERQSGAFGN